MKKRWSISKLWMLVVFKISGSTDFTVNQGYRVESGHYNCYKVRPKKKQAILKSSRSGYKKRRH